MDWTALWEKVKIFFSATWDLLYPFIKQFMSEEGAMILAMSLNTVMEIEATMGDASGADKRAEALVRLQSALVSQGFKIGIAILSSAIEMAVARMRASEEVVAEAKAIQECFASPPIQTVQP